MIVLFRSVWERVHDGIFLFVAEGGFGEDKYDLEPRIRAKFGYQQLSTLKSPMTGGAIFPPIRNLRHPLQPGTE